MNVMTPDVSLKEENENINIFWFAEVVRDSTKWKIDHLKFTKFLYQNGFRRYDMGKNYIFIQLEDNVIEELPVQSIQDFLIDYIEKLGDDFLGKEGKGISKAELLTKFYTSPQIFFNEKKLSLLGIEPNLTFNSDNKDCSYIYFSNGFVKCTADGYDLLPYSELDGYIFKNQRKNRKFRPHSDDGMFKLFIKNICGKDEHRFLAFQTILGYLLHGYFDTKMKAVNLTDSTISDVAEGRTGKTLIGKSISKIKNVCEVNGKDFNPADKHKYSSASIDSQIIFINDLTKRFDFEALFNDVSEGITVDKKNQHPFKIMAKMLIASNDTFRVEGGSAKDRVLEFELAEYYSSEFSPFDEFGCWFFADWDETEWLKFDNFMVNCISIYLKHGLIEAPQINLEKRKQIEHTNRDFVEFMDEKIKTGQLVKGKDYDKRILHNEFLEAFDGYREDRWFKRPANFTKYLKTYASYSSELKGKIMEKRSNGKSYIKFEKNEEQVSKLPF